MENPWVSTTIATAKAAATTTSHLLTFLGGGIAGDSDMAAAGWNRVANEDRSATIATVMMVAAKIPKLAAVEQSVAYGSLNRGPLAADIADTFRSGSYMARTLSKDTILYRVTSKDGNATGSYWTRTKPQGPVQSIIDSALDRKWGNAATEVHTATVPAGTTIYEGTAAAQGGLVGGGNQIYIPKVDPSWVH